MARRFYRSRRVPSCSSGGLEAQGFSEGLYCVFYKGFGSLISASNVSISIRSKCYLSRTKQPQGEADVQHLRIRPPPATGADGTESALSASCSSSPCGGEEARMQEPGAGSYTVEICYRGHEYVVLLLAPRSERRLGRNQIHGYHTNLGVHATGLGRMTAGSSRIQKQQHQTLIFPSQKMKAHIHLEP